MTGAGADRGVRPAADAAPESVPADGTAVSSALLSRLAEARGAPLTADRGEIVASAVQAMFDFTRELDEVDTRDAMPATVFVAPAA